MSKAKKSDLGENSSATPSADSDSGLSFESALEQLETTVARLEEGEMPLEEALALFEKGVSLSRQCATTLEAAEKRIEILIADREDGQTEPFERDEEEDFDEED